MYKHILIPTDGSELSARAIREGIDFAKDTNARVTLLTVSSPFHVFASEPMMVTDTQDTYEAHAETNARARLKVGEDLAKAKGVPAKAEHVFAEHPFAAIVDSADKDGCDLIFMASHGRKGITGVLIGSETQRVLTHTKIPVVVCH